MGPAIEGRTVVFEGQRRRLFGLAYRILGSRADAEDIVQERYLRWQRVDEPVRSAEAWLTTVVTRLAVDRLRSAQAQREAYTGPGCRSRSWSGTRGRPRTASTPLRTCRSRSCTCWSG